MIGSRQSDWPEIEIMPGTGGCTSPLCLGNRVLVIGLDPAIVRFRHTIRILGLPSSRLCRRVAC